MTTFYSMSVAVACASAGLAGFIFSQVWWRMQEARRRRESVKTAAAQGAGIDDGLLLESKGVVASVIGLARRESLKRDMGDTAMGSLVDVADRFSRHFDEQVLKAGLRSSITRTGYATTRLVLAGLSACAGAVLGVFFSTELALIFAMTGLCAGWAALPGALRKESQIRSARLESQLGEMVEVVALGLHSGLSFDRAFALYCEHFESGFSWACGRAQKEWSLGLLARDEALRTLAVSYDSPLLARVMENIIRSLRFGSSLVEMLETTAVEVRSVHKANVEERVAKAPVKMLIPVGTLILPAMLIFVLGPIMIDLMKGM